MPQYLTYNDAVEHLLDYLGGSPGEVVVRDIRRSVREAYTELVNCHNWPYLYKLGRISAHGTFADGTIEYTQSDRTLVLTGATWPSWILDGNIRVGYVTLKPESKVNDTTIIIDSLLNPGRDISEGSGFIAYQDTFILPEDYISQDQSLFEQNFGGMHYTHVRDWAYGQRYQFSLGIPQYYTIVGSDRHAGRMSLKVWPYPTDTKTIDFVYKRRPKDLVLQSYSSGAITTTAGSSSVVLSSGTLQPSMAGSVLRVSRGSSQPSSWVGHSAPDFESVISSVVDSTHATLEDSASFSGSSLKYMISDRIDIEEGAMRAAFLRGCERQISMTRVLKDKPSAERQYQAALDAARDAASPSFAGRRAGPSARIRMRLRDMPRGPDQP